MVIPRSYFLFNMPSSTCSKPKSINALFPSLIQFLHLSLPGPIYCPGRNKDASLDFSILEYSTCRFQEFLPQSSFNPAPSFFGPTEPVSSPRHYIWRDSHFTRPTTKNRRLKKKIKFENAALVLKTSFIAF